MPKRTAHQISELFMLEVLESAEEPIAVVQSDKYLSHITEKFAELGFKEHQNNRFLQILKEESQRSADISELREYFLHSLKNLHDQHMSFMWFSIPDAPEKPNSPNIK